MFEECKSEKERERGAVIFSGNSCITQVGTVEEEKVSIYPVELMAGERERERNSSNLQITRIVDS